MEGREEQITDTLLMIRPSLFEFNDETAESNIFQNSSGIKKESIHSQALMEFDSLVKNLRENRVYVIVLQDSGMPSTPDSLFPNNWVSFHPGKMILYPMLAENRRMERRNDWIELLKHTLGISEVKNFSAEELKGKFLEGTGSLVLDRRNKIAYANLSSRTNFELLQQWCNEMNFELISFKAQTSGDKEIYHTNVLMAIGEETAMICSEVIHDEIERKKVLSKLSAHHRVVEISEGQMMCFAGNMLLIKNRDGEKFWLMSEQAFNCLSASQKETLKPDGEFLFSDLKMIESVGGGSARCMITEVFSKL